MMKSKFLFFLLALALWGLSPLYALTPTEIIHKADKLDDGETSISEMTMILIDSRGQQRVRKIKGYRKDYGEDSKSISFFLSPADVRNTAFLSYEYDDVSKEDDNWLYLPALRKVKRIASGNKKDSFMGTDFTYHDMNGLEVEEWAYSMVKESDTVNGKDCWVIGAVPRKEIAKAVIKDTSYVKRVVWVRKDNFMAVQAKIWMKKAGKTKIMKASKIERIQGIWTARQVEMSTLDRRGRRSHSTILRFDNLQYNKGVGDDMFNTQRMERGL